MTSGNKGRAMNATLNFGLELKALAGREFEGHGSVFGNMDHGGDVVVQGAFKRSLAAHKKAGTMPSMFWMHKPDHVAGVWHAMREDEKGLHVRGELAATPLGDEMHALLKLKAVSGLSIGYQTVESDFSRDGARLLKELNLVEVSIVSLAMNPLAKVEAVKSSLSRTGEYVPSEREFEKLLRDAGISRKAARHICAKVFDDEQTSETLDLPRRWDAGKVEVNENDDLMQALQGLRAKIRA